MSLKGTVTGMKISAMYNYEGLIESGYSHVRPHLYDLEIYGTFWKKIGSAGWNKRKLESADFCA